MQLIKGSELTASQISQVKAAFIYRHAAIGEGLWYKTEQAWIEDHAFYFTKAGNLSRRHKFAQPWFMASLEVG